MIVDVGIPTVVKGKGSWLLYVKVCAFYTCFNKDKGLSFTRNKNK